MNERDLCNLKEKLLMDAYRKVKRDDFASEEAYLHYLSGVEDGILNFYASFLLQQIAGDTKPLKKIA